MAECEISNLRAREDSILTSGFLPSQEKNRLKVLDSSSSTSVEENKDHIGVYLRIKKMDTLDNIYEILDEKTLLCRVPEGTNSIGNCAKMSRMYKFSKIFCPESSQTTIFNSIVKRKVLSVINGLNCNLLTYGASESGKTYTVVGTPSQPGLIPRTLEYLFRNLAPLPKEPLIKPLASGGTIQLPDSERQTETSVRDRLLNNLHVYKHKQTYKMIQESLNKEPGAELLNDTTDLSLAIWVSFVKIHDEWIYDLLAPDPPRGQLQKKMGIGYCNGDAYIKDVTFIYTKSSLQAYQILQCGLQKLQYTETSSKSNKSHFIFTIKLISSSNAGASVPVVSTFNFCNLAGYERFNKVQNIGGRLNKTTKINNSLVVLGRCINLIRNARIHPNKIIPFRESKLTQLLQKALLGHEAMSIIININPSKAMFDETQHVLNFPAIAANAEQQKSIATTFSYYMNNNSPVSPITVGMSPRNHLINDLLLQIEILPEEIQKEKHAAKEEREFIIATYKSHIDQAQRYWENRCRKLELAIKKNRNIELNEVNKKIISMSSLKHKKTNEIIVIDSDSSDEDINNEIEDNNSNVNYSKRSFPDVQNETIKLRRELHFKDSVIKELSTETDRLRKDIEDWHKAKQKLEMENNEIIEDLQSILNQKNKMLENLSIWSDNHFEY